MTRYILNGLAPYTSLLAFVLREGEGAGTGGAEPAAPAAAAEPAAPATPVTLLGGDGVAPAAPAAAEPPASTYVDDPSKSAEENAAAKAEHDAKAAKDGDDKKDGDKPANEYLGAPEAYDIKTPEGFQVDETIKGEFESAAKEIGLSQKGVERLVAIQTKLQENQATKTAELVKKWGEDIKADKELGGNDYQAKAAKAVEFRKAFFSDDAKALLDKSGLGNHPEIVRGFYRAGMAMGEAIAHKGGASQQQDAATILYGS